MADKYSLTLLPEIHASYEDKTYEQLTQKGYMTYDFFLPGLIIDALESKNGTILASRALELQEKQIHVIDSLYY